MSLRRHTLQNLAGAALPAFAGIVSVPAFLHLIGPERFGVLAIVWLFVGYFGLFDLGLSRAAAFHIARLHNAPPAIRADVFYTGIVINGGFGVLGGVLLLVAAPPLFLHVFRMPDQFRGEVITALPWLAAVIPVATLSSLCNGTLEAREAFGIANAIGATAAIAMQIAPLAVAYFHGPDLQWLIAAVVISRVLTMLPLAAAIRIVLPLGHGGAFRRVLLRKLFGYGGWIMLSSVLDPLLTAMDRTLIASLAGATAVAYYSVPFNMVWRVASLPGALSASLFPRLSRHGGAEQAKLAATAIVTLSAMLTPIVVGGILTMPIFMRLWVGESFAARAAPIGMVLFIGIWANGLAFIPYGQLQAGNRPDLTAKFHALEVIPFLAILWAGLHFFGLIGAAIAWSLRVAVDAALLFAATKQARTALAVLPGWLLAFLALPLAPEGLVSARSLLAILLMLAACIWSLYCWKRHTVG